MALALSYLLIVYFAIFEKSSNSLVIYFASPFNHAKTEK